MKQNIISIQLKNNQIKKIVNFFDQYQIESSNPYVSYQFKYQKSTISIFKTLKMVIQGNNLESLIFLFKNKLGINLNSNKDNSIKEFNEWNFNQFAMIGCDEVGVGDFFGGLVTVCVYLDYNDFLKAKTLNIHDSKRLSDAKILEIYPILIKEFKYSVASFSANEYNQFYLRFPNNHLIKTYLHNKALSKLINQINHSQTYKIVMDAYVSQKKYCQYLNELAINNPVNIDYFVTQAEEKYLAVGIASMIARATFLIQMQKLNAKFNMVIPLGGHYDKIYNASVYILNNYGKEIFDKLVKQHFKTYDLVLKQYQNQKN